MVRIRHQARDIEQGREPNNYIQTETIPAADRHNSQRRSSNKQRAKISALPLPFVQSMRTL